ncbi:MAG: hypothetical protein MUE85_10295 [Microscillaceae bacterium]|jgi:hypothetical protein|nr:hypothetical protein [Microscillaceae bacterium]
MKNTKAAKNIENQATETTTTQAKAETTEAKAENKNAFDILLETQTKLVDSIVDNSKKLADSLKATETIEKSRTFVNEWLEKQQTNLESASENLKKQVKFENAPELVKVVVEAQQTLGKEWFEAFRATLKAKDVKELNNIFSANVNKLQSNVKEVANFWRENFGKPVNMNEVLTTEYAKEVTTKVVELMKPADVK